MADCVICIEDIAIDDSTKILICKHTYHKVCFDDYTEHEIKIYKDVLCPLCRNKVDVKLTRKQKLRKFIRSKKARVKEFLYYSLGAGIILMFFSVAFSGFIILLI